MGSLEGQTSQPHLCPAGLQAVELCSSVVLHGVWTSGIKNGEKRNKALPPNFWNFTAPPRKQEEHQKRD